MLLLSLLSLVIVSRDGPDENVIKIKPPLVFSKKDVDTLGNTNTNTNTNTYASTNTNTYIS